MVRIVFRAGRKPARRKDDRRGLFLDFSPTFSLPVGADHAPDGVESRPADGSGHNLAGFVDELDGAFARIWFLAGCRTTLWTRRNFICLHV